MTSIYRTESRRGCSRGASPILSGFAGGSSSGPLRVQSHGSASVAGFRCGRLLADRDLTAWPPFSEERIDLRPERLPFLPLGLGELGQGLGVSDAGEVAILLPVIEGLGDERAGLGRAGFEELRPGGELGLQPADRLLSELRPGGLIGRRVVLALPGCGQRRGAGGVVAVLGPAVVAELRVGFEGLGPEPGGGGVTFRVVAHLGQNQALEDVIGTVLPFQQGREPLGQRRQPFGVGNPLRRGIAPDWLLAAQVVPLAIHRERAGVIALTSEGAAEIAVGLGAVGLEPDRLAACGDGLVELPQISQDVAEVAVGQDVIGLEPDRLAVCGDGLVELSLARQDFAEAGVGQGVSGLDPDRLAAFGDGLVELPLLTQEDAEVEVGLGVVGIEPDRLAAFGDGLVELPLEGQSVAKGGVGRGVVGIEPDRLAAFGGGLIELPLVSQDAAEVGVGLGVVGLEPDRLAVCGDGLVELPLATQGKAEAVVGDGVVGLEPDRLAEFGDGFLVLPLEFKGDAEVCCGSWRFWD